MSARRRHYGFVFRQLIGAVTLYALAGTALLTLGGFLVIRGQLTLGQLVAAELIVSAALVSFVKFGKQLESFYDLLAGVDKLGILFDLPLDEDLGEPHPARSAGAVLETRGASYRYAGHANGLPAFDMRVAAGERVAVIGARGAGKSTLAELCCGLRTPDSGVVMLDGVDIREIADDSVRLQMNLVKGFEIVDGSVLDNVRLGRTDISTEDIRDALRRLGILDDLLALPEGLRTQISSVGAPLSRVTALLLMLARSTVGQPRAIVVDGVLDELHGASLRTALAALTDPAAPWTLLVLTSREDIGATMDRTVNLTQRKSPPGVALLTGGAA